LKGPSSTKELDKELDRLGVTGEVGAISSRSANALPAFVALLRELPTRAMMLDEIWELWESRCALADAPCAASDLAIGSPQSIRVHFESRPLETFAQISYVIKPGGREVWQRLWLLLQRQLDEVGLQYHQAMMFDEEAEGARCLVTVDADSSPEARTHMVAWLLTQPCVVSAREMAPPYPTVETEP